MGALAKVRGQALAVTRGAISTTLRHRLTVWPNHFVVPAAVPVEVVWCKHEEAERGPPVGLAGRAEPAPGEKRAGCLRRSQAALLRRLGKVAGEGAGCAWIDVGTSRVRNVDEAASEHAELHLRSACYVARGQRRQGFSSPRARSITAGRERAEFARRSATDCGSNAANYVAFWPWVKGRDLARVTTYLVTQRNVRNVTCPASSVPQSFAATACVAPLPPCPSAASSSSTSSSTCRRYRAANG